MIRVAGQTAIGAHRLAWLWVHGDLPPKVDHEDLDKANNKIGNLRVATQSQNQANTPISKRNKSGFKGVHFCRERKIKPWRASVRVMGKLNNVGRFSTAEEAHAAYAVAAKSAFGEFARLA